MKTHIGVLVQHPTQSHLINNLCVRLGAGGNNTTVVAAKTNQKLLDKPDTVFFFKVFLPHADSRFN